MRILAVDLGRSRTGLAISDPMEVLSSPIGTVTEYHVDRLADRVAETAKEREAETIVVGLPKNMDGSSGDSVSRANQFAEMLRERVDIPVVTWDERLTTMEAGRYLSQTGVYGEKRKKMVDTVAATVILDSYLLYRKNQSQKTDEGSEDEEEETTE